MKNCSRMFAGIDWASKTHMICVVDPPVGTNRLGDGGYRRWSLLGRRGLQGVDLHSEIRLGGAPWRWKREQVGYLILDR